MGIWDSYFERVSDVGSYREAAIEDAKMQISITAPESPSFHEIKMNGRTIHATITKGQTISEKRISAIPNERLIHGGIVEFAGGHWLITELDADNEIYDRGTMIRCNHILRWIGEDGELKQKWCYIEDGTKYLIGEHAELKMSVGDSRIALTIGKDSDTIALKRGMRFLIDDVDSEDVIAYQITKANRLFNIYEGEGVYRFILKEVQLTQHDNIQMRIADYSNWEPPTENDSAHVDSDSSVSDIVSDAIKESGSAPEDNEGGWI